MKKCAYIVGLILVFSTGLGFGQESMTPARFREIVNSPGDTVPLVPQLAPVPFWTNAVVSNVMTYASGKVFREKMNGTSHSVQGKYIVFTIQSEFYHQTMHSILTYTAEPSTLKTYSLFDDGHRGEILTEVTTRYDLVRKTYTGTSSYGDGFMETTTGSFTDKVDFSKTMVYKNGVLFLTREVTTRPTNNSNPASPGT